MCSFLWLNEGKYVHINKYIYIYKMYIWIVWVCLILLHLSTVLGGQCSMDDTRVQSTDCMLENVTRRQQSFYFTLVFGKAIHR